MTRMYSLYIQFKGGMKYNVLEDLKKVKYHRYKNLQY